MVDLLARFLVGGAVVCAFAAVGDHCKPKTLGGVFGAAPTVALATLGLAFVRDGRAHVAIEGRSMLAGAVAFAAYGLAVSRLVMVDRIPAWLCAGMAWSVWLATALVAWCAIVA
jgi:hypothetical protein